jgi:hypothetical protein
MASCEHCPHCRELAELAGLRLSPHRPQPGSTSVDVAFYRDFGAVYDLAVSRGYRQPMRMIRQVNPDLSPSRCRDYLKRARALGVVRTPQRTAETVEDQVAGCNTAPDPEVARVLANPGIANMREAGVPITVQALVYFGLAADEEAAAALVARLPAPSPA